jgi:hypothetical protein
VPWGSDNGHIPKPGEVNDGGMPALGMIGELCLTDINGAERYGAKFHPHRVNFQG